MKNSIKNLKRAFTYAKSMGYNEADFYNIQVWQNEITFQGVHDGRELIDFEDEQKDGFRRHLGFAEGLYIRIVLETKYV